MTMLRSSTLLVTVLFCAGSTALLGQKQAQPAVPEIHLTFTTMDVPGASITQPNGINTAGDIVGFYGQSASGILGGFLCHNGTFNFFNYPGQDETIPGGINDSGLIVGSATQIPSERTTVVGFLYDGANFTTFKDGSNVATYGLGLNNAGVVVGEAGTLFSTNAFELVNGHYKTINFPGSYNYGFANSVNSQGLVVGWTISGVTDLGYMVKSGRVRDVSIPGAQRTAALGVNDDGIVVGWYNPTTTNDYHGFALKNGKHFSFDYPGAVWTFATGINKSGQVVGTYSFDRVAFHGFVTDPITTADFK